MFYLHNVIFSISYRVNKHLLPPVEHQRANQQQRDHDAETVREPAPAELSGAHGTVLERLCDGCQRIEPHDVCQRLVLYYTHWIHNRRGIHPQ